MVYLNVCINRDIPVFPAPSPAFGWPRSQAFPGSNFWLFAQYNVYLGRQGVKLDEWCWFRHILYMWMKYTHPHLWETPKVLRVHADFAVVYWGKKPSLFVVVSMQKCYWVSERFFHTQFLPVLPHTRIHNYESLIVCHTKSRGMWRCVRTRMYTVTICS